MLHLFHVGRTPVAAGLAWRAASGENGGAPSRADLAELADRQDTKYGVRVDAPDGRVLLGLLPEGASRADRRAVSGAAWLAHAAETRTLYVERVQPGRYWVVVAGRGQIEPRTDRVFDETATSSLVDELLTELAHAPEPTRVVLAPDTSLDSIMLSRSDVQSLPFSALVSHSDAKSSMRPVQLRGTRPFVWGALAAIALGIVASFGLLYHLKQVRAQREFEEQQARLRAQAIEMEQLRTQREANISEAILRSLAEDTETPAPDALLAECLRVFGDVGLEAAGWRVINVECAANASSANIAFELPPTSSGGVGTHASLREWALTRFRNLPSFSNDNYRAQLALPITLPARRERLKLAQLSGQNLLYPIIHTRLELLAMATPDVNYALTPLAPKAIVFDDPTKNTVTDPGQGADRFSPVPPERAYRIGQITINGREIDGIVGMRFNDWSFFTLNKIAIRPSEFEIAWTLEAAYVAASQG